MILRVDLEYRTVELPGFGQVGIVDKGDPGSVLNVRMITLDDEMIKRALKEIRHNADRPAPKQSRPDPTRGGQLG